MRGGETDGRSRKESSNKERTKEEGRGRERWREENRRERERGGLKQCDKEIIKGTL